MSVFAISFRIGDENSPYGGYDTRYDSVNECIRQCATNGTYWDETTSFILIDSQFDSSDEVRSALKQNAVYDENLDLILIINLTKIGFKTLGTYTDSDLDKIMASRRSSSGG
ncbi:hypothetical protein J7481_09535 [Labrenzia sp. R4_2]|uniref:hypothetical protein n=1 Tax=Labrenzia sp. R4_2 TaxID=2821107 RepID=UPI001AD9DAF6|nr:hypothetical protein [Labrenzia sp. R4_2]MBO9419733.1 hypothetical protein [Labrenzia sp. R4_2]